MPRTPTELRPEKIRTSSTGKRIALPSRLASSTSSFAVQVATAIRRSSASSPSNFIAILPFAMTLPKSESALRRTLPLAVANITLNWPQLASSSGSGRTAEIFSPGARLGSRFTMALPRACGVPTGSL